MARPVFYDASGGRKRWSSRVRWALGLFIAIAIGIFVYTIVDVPVPGPLHLGQGSGYQAVPFKPKKSVVARIGKWLPSPSRAPDGRQLRVGFYVPWDDASKVSLRAHAGELDWVVPALGSVLGPGHRLVVTPDPAFDALMARNPDTPKVLPMVQNTLDGNWDVANTVSLFADPAVRARLIADAEALVRAKHGVGIAFDFENLPPDALPNYERFIAEAHAKLSKDHLLVTLAVPADNPDWNLKAFARHADKLFVMDYDEHYANGTPGSIASQDWFVSRMDRAVREIGRDKTIVALGAYGNDWAEGKTANAVTIEEAWLIAHDSQAPIRFDPDSGNATFDYEENGTLHHVWMLDAASNWNQLRAADIANVAGVAIWRLGSEDHSLWRALAAFETGKRPDLSNLRSLGNVDVQGSGEILHIDDVPVSGHRDVKFADDGLITGESFTQLPTPFVVRRTGAQAKQVALTFDDGPDETWTPKILDILKAKHAPAAFFVVGENAMMHPGLLNRVVSEGSELGNHSFTHPNLSNDAPETIRLELNTTRRLVEAYTGHSMRLFRAPYFGDAEPTTSDELYPALTAQEHGYINVGLHIDPGDWKRPGADQIVQQTFRQLADPNPDRSENIVLLHDGGGDRSQTVAALPAIIDGLRERGYEIVPVGQLAGLAPVQTMPTISGSDLAAVRADVAIFLALAAIEYGLGWIFLAAIVLGIARAVILAILARHNAKRERGRTPPPIDPERFVSVIIPAYNEARVIEASVARVLESTEVKLEVIVADDGSKDETSAIVARAFGEDPRVRLLTMENGGKASALNRAMALAKGEIIIALDADTQFEPETIARLARWFDDPGIGAVAGNAMVGNRINLVTRWQAIEYVTAQNLERRALARFDAMTVVPGAVGAWRRSALESVGFYPEDTLAEDQDLTIAIQRKGWKVTYDADAVAWTEAPETFRALAKQRYRWAFGTLQCLWKHRAILKERKPRGLALIGIPQAWLFQIGFAMISPLIDLALVVSILGTVFRVMSHGWVQTQGDVGTMALFWLAFTTIDIACGWIAFRLEPRAKHYPAFLLVAQRFVYRQLMYGVVFKAVVSAIHGPRVGWGKLDRSGSVTAPVAAEKQREPEPA